MSRDGFEHTALNALRGVLFASICVLMASARRFVSMRSSSGSISGKAAGFDVPEGFELGDWGVKKIKKATGKGEEQSESSFMISDTATFIERCERDVQTQAELWTVRYRLRDTGRYESVCIPHGAVNSTRDLQAMLLNRVPISVDQRRHADFCEYLRRGAHKMKEIGQYKSTTGWVQLEDGWHLVPYSEKIRFHLQPGSEQDAKNRKHEHQLTPSGSMNTWISSVLEPLSVCPAFLTAFALCCVSPLLAHIPGLPPFSVNLASQSGTGKSRAAHAILSGFAQSVPESSDGSPLFTVQGSVSASSNGLMQMLNLFHDLPLCFDDAQGAKIEDIQELVYAIGNASEQKKCMQDGTLREGAKAHSVVLFTSEVDLTSKFSYDGGSARMITIEQPPFEGLSLENRRAVLGRCSSVQAKHYGHIGLFLSQQIARCVNGDEKAIDLVAHHEVLKKRLLDLAKGHTGLVVDRHCSLYAAALLVAELLKGIVPERVYSAMVQAVISHWMHSINSKETGLMPERAMRMLREYVTCNSSQFKADSFDSKRPGEILKEGDLAILYTSLDRILGPDVDTQNVLSQWKSKGWLVQSQSMAKKGNLSVASINGKKIQCIRIRKDIIEGSFEE